MAGDGAFGGNGAVVAGLRVRWEEAAILVLVFAYGLWWAGW